ncbi:hypothetical protein LCGC14_1174910 [marine sediment metagenome]|uniref:DUF2786 domain-containing protein n=1 Tax=marine sediment metagenome TaxID=412755 RepID=A0A0F9LNW2_9ZZZZ
MADKRNILDLVQKCLNLGKSPNENEAAVAIATAQALIEKYNLSDEDLRREETTSTTQAKMVNIPVPIGQSEWKRYLLNCIASQHFCKTVISGKNLHFLGREVNVYASLMISSWIIPQLENLAFFEAHTYTGPESKLRYRNSVLWGASTTIYKRLQESRAERITHSTNLKALIVNLATETTNYTREQYPRLTTHGGSDTPLSGEGYARGRAAGESIDLHGSRHQIEGGPKLLPSGE